MAESHIFNTKNMSAYSHFSNTINNKYLNLNNGKEIDIKVPDALLKYFKDKTLKYNLDKRIFYYKHITNKLKDINNKQCLKEYAINSKKNEDVHGYNIDDTVFLTKKFGSISKYGYIYIASIKNEFGKYPIASKIMINNRVNLFEAQINLKITDKVIKNMISRHFILTYKVIICDKMSNKNLPDIVLNKKYYVLLNELARGDLKQLCNSKMFLKNNSALYNVFIQIMLSISTFHHLGFIHGDCHWGNFLYHINYNVVKNSYHHYIIYGKNYYLKSCEYTMYIYDFGFAEKIKSVKMSLIDSDYRRLINAFRNKKIEPRSWISVDNNLPSDEVGEYVKTFRKAIDNNRRSGRSSGSSGDSSSSGSSDSIYKNNSIYLEKLTINTILPTLLKAPEKIFVTKLPANASVINKKPYYINKKILIKD
jgi:hypothetical protein